MNFFTQNNFLYPVSIFAPKTLISCCDFLIIADDNSLEGRKLLGMHLDRNQSLFYVEVPGGTILSHVVEENEKFPAQFGREVRI